MVPLDFWNLARRLIDTEPNPEGYRSSVSRSYYGAFLTAVAFLESLGVHFDRNDPSVHKKIRDILSNSRDEELEIAASSLGDLRRHRNQADYHLNDRDIETEASAELRHSEAATIIGKLTTCKNEAKRLATVAAVIADYAQNVLQLRVSRPT